MDIVFRSRPRCPRKINGWWAKTDPSSVLFRSRTTCPFPPHVCAIHIVWPSILELELERQNELWFFNFRRQRPWCKIWLSNEKGHHLGPWGEFSPNSVAKIRKNKRHPALEECVSFRIDSKVWLWGFSVHGQIPDTSGLEATAGTGRSRSLPLAYCCYRPKVYTILAQAWASDCGERKLDKLGGFWFIRAQIS